MSVFEKLGYYLIEKTINPENNCVLLTASDCVCNIHPQSDVFLESEKDITQSRYFKELGLTAQEALEFARQIQKLREENRITIDRRFVSIEDAKRVYHTFFKKIEGIQLISISVENSYLPILEQEMEEDFFIVRDNEEGNEIGYDLLGWDMAGFHSYFCNGLDELINTRYTMEYNESGLIKNNYEEVKEFARCIEGEGEPVEWIPYKVEEYRLGGNL